MSVTYTVTEDSGFKHTRTSARHTQAEYAFAVVRVPGGRKSQVSYCSRFDLAQSVLSQAMRHKAGGEPYYPQAKIYPVSAVVKGRA